jgi:co-chaperonin GroES (HSP10)
VRSLKRKDYMLNKNTFITLALAASVGLIAPNLASAQGGLLGDGLNKDIKGDLNLNLHSKVDREGSNRDDQRDDRNLRSNEDRRQDRHQEYEGDRWLNQYRAISGEVTATSDNSLTIENGERTFTVNTTGAALVQVPNLTISLNDIEVGDRVVVKGTKSDSTITASHVYVVPGNLHLAKTKGTVTAVNDGTITLQNKDGESVTVHTTADTNVSQEGNEDATVADVEVGSEVKVKGFWDSVTEFFHALKIRLF